MNQVQTETETAARIPEKTIQRRTRTIREVAKVLGLSVPSAYEAAKRGEIPTVKFGRRLLVPVAALNRMLEGSK